MGDVLLEINNLVTEFIVDREPLKAVAGVSFYINKGQTVGIVGESGSGKSVTALSIMRLIKQPGRIKKGEVIYHSQRWGKVDLAAIPEKHMREFRGKELGMIFQEPLSSLNPVYTCGQQVMEALQLHLGLSKKAARARTIELFEEVQLPRPEQMVDAYPHQLSGGQKQRVMIAMAMSCNPSLLIADEPTTALDVTVQKTILDLMRGLQQRHRMGILFITHDLGVIAELADYLLVMYKGKIVEQGTVEAIFTRPQHPYTKGLLACRPPLNKRLVKLPTISDFIRMDGEGVFHETSTSIEQMTSALTVSLHERELQHKAMYAAPPLLELKNVSTWFPVKNGLFGKTQSFVKAVDDVSFDVYKGETLGLVGESGCGKTTLGRTILHLIEPTSGAILFKGRDIAHLSKRELRNMRKHIQIVFQDPYASLNPMITIGAAIMEPMRVHGIYATAKECKDRAMELLTRVNMDASHFYRYPHEFSGGQRQRVCIARALSLNPEFIICDESVSALDVSVQAQVLNLLNELKKDFGFSYIFISHDLSVVKFMSDRMVVMNKGRIVEMGEADSVYSNPQAEYTRNLIASIPAGEAKFRI